jgi:hypothetical protein
MHIVFFTNLSEASNKSVHAIENRLVTWRLAPWKNPRAIHSTVKISNKMMAIITARIYKKGALSKTEARTVFRKQWFGKYSRPMLETCDHLKK